MLNAELELAHTVLSNIDQHIQVLENNRVTLTRWIERYKHNGGDSSNKKLKLDPFAPKRPLTAYLQWCADNKSHYRSQYPLLNSKELLAHMGQQWTSLDAIVKADYIKAAEARMSEYGAIKADYDRSSVSSDVLDMSIMMNYN